MVDESEYNKIVKARKSLPPWGAELRILGALAPTKFLEKIFQWAGTHKGLAENVNVNKNFRRFTLLNIAK